MRLSASAASGGLSLLGNEWSNGKQDDGRKGQEVFQATGEGWEGGMGPTRPVDAVEYTQKKNLDVEKQLFTEIPFGTESRRCLAQDKAAQRPLA